MTSWVSATRNSRNKKPLAETQQNLEFLKLRQHAISYLKTLVLNKIQLARSI